MKGIFKRLSSLCLVTTLLTTVIPCIADGAETEDEKTVIYQNDYDNGSTAGYFFGLGGGTAWNADMAPTVKDPTGCGHGLVKKFSTQGKDQYKWGKISVIGLSANGTWSSDKKYSEYGMTDDKTLFASADFYIPSAEVRRLSDNDYYLIGLGAEAARAMNGSGKIKLTKASEDGSALKVTANDNASDGINMTVPADEWFTVSFVHNPWKTNGYYYTKVYINDEYFGNLQTYDSTYSHVTSEQKMLGIRFLASDNVIVGFDRNSDDGFTAADTAIYLDNVYMYQMKDSIGLKNINYDVLDSVLRAEFTTAVNGESLQNIKLEMDGADMNAVITDRSLDSDRHSIELTLDRTGIKFLRDYEIVIPKGFTDDNGQELGEEKRFSFRTPKSGDIYIDMEDENTEISLNGKELNEVETVSGKLTVKNITGRDANIIGAVAVYGDNEELLGIGFTELTEGVNPFEVTEIKHGGKTVRVYCWEMIGNNIFKLLHEPDKAIGSEMPKEVLKREYALPDFTVEMTNVENSVMSISGKCASNEEGSFYTIIALDGNDTRFDYTDKSNIEALTYAVVKDGGFGSEFLFNKVSGDYTFKVFTDGNEYSKTIPYASISDIAEKCAKKLENDELAQSEIYETLYQYRGGLNISFEKEFLSERDKNLLERRLYERRKNLNGPSDIEYASQLAAEIDNVKKEITYLNELKGIEYWGLIKDKLEEGKDLTGIDINKLNNISDDKQKKVLELFLGKDFVDAEAVKKFFDSNISDTENSGVGGTVSISNSKGGGKGGGVSSYNPSTVKTPVVSEAKPADAFTDLSGYEWAGEAILRLTKIGIINGVSENEFAPSECVTREQLVKMIVLTLNIHEKGIHSEFADVERDTWYDSYIASAKKKEIVNGISEDSFGVGENIIRQDMAVMIYNALKYKGLEMQGEKAGFADENEIADYAKEPVALLCGSGIINGVGENTFAPNAFATRAEAAVLIERLERSK